MSTEQRVSHFLSSGHSREIASRWPDEFVQDRLSGANDGLPAAMQAAGSFVQTKDDRTLFEEVFLPHRTEAYRLARWLTGNASDAEDVVQDAALRAFRGIRSFGAVSARAWSLTIVRNTAYNWLMKNRPKSVVYVDELSLAERQRLERETAQGTRIETPEEAALLKEDAASLQRALAQLPIPFREVIVLREINQLNYREIAEITNSPIGTVMSRLSRARRLLIEFLGEQTP